MSKIRQLSDKSLNDLAEMKRRTLGVSPSLSVPSTGGRGEAVWYWGELLATLEAPDDGWQEPTPGYAKLMVPDPASSTNPRPFIEMAKGAITGATNADPIVITSAAHNRRAGDFIYITGVLGNTAANGPFYIASVTTDTFTLVDGVGNGAYSSAGTWYLAMEFVNREGLALDAGTIVKIERAWGENSLKRNEPEDTGCDCCPECCGTLWYIQDDQILWTADHFAGETAANIAAYSFTTRALSCDADADGNVYQGGVNSALLETSLTKPQGKMYTLRAYTSAGALKWSWATHEFGWINGVVRAAPNPVAKIRCGGNHIFVQQIDETTNDNVFRRFDQDGNIVWTLHSDDLDPMVTGSASGWILVAAGPTRVLFAGAGSGGTSRFLITDHDGDYVWDDTDTSSAALSWMDDDDQTWEVFQSGSPPPTGVGYADANGGGSVSVSLSPYSATSIRATPDVVLLSNGTTVRTYPGDDIDPLLNSVTIAETAMMLSSDRVGTRTDTYARLRNLDLSVNSCFRGLLTTTDTSNITDWMPNPAGGGSVACGRRRCGVSLIPEGAAD